MPSSLLVAYATQYGSTQEVAEAMASVLRERGVLVDVKPARDVSALQQYDAVVLGAPLCMFHWHKEALRFLARHHKNLVERKVAVFALGPVHHPYDEKEWCDAQAQLDKELAPFPWLNPVEIKVLGGKYDPSKLRFPIKMLAGKAPASDVRDWAEIRSWAASLTAKLEL